MSKRSIFIKVSVIVFVFFVFLVFFHHRKPKIKVPFVPTKEDIFDIGTPFFLEEKTPFRCFRIGECSLCPENITIPPCDKNPRYRLNIHCKYDETEEDQSKLPPLPSWVSCFPAKNLEKVHFFIVQVFFAVTSFISVSFIVWRRYIRHE
ncbi:hypothetical protein PNEG_02557 [Pneumocystis murina B123]|uniref:Uncharacterized protein n=1 Tax=Pneumocystis murina (strain B123) TaxID=1069680 RepID=M7NQ38_PNEMU|nr:hypothetical protein PNEG_02557 [Pneumocystis murina B123]EMR09221.1 hypothetical protein PNEG_02557 [Pneumocystis murina B123]